MMSDSWMLRMTSFALLCCMLQVDANNAVWKQDEDFIRSCVAQTQNGLVDSDADLDRKIQTVCEAKQRFGDCLAGPRVGGQLLQLIRYYRWQENEADVRLDICPDLKFDNLKRLVNDTDLARRLAEKQSVVEDDFSPCGADIFKDCINSVPTPMANVVRAMYTFLQCVEENKATCSASLIQHFANLAHEVQGVLKMEEAAFE